MPRTSHWSRRRFITTAGLGLGAAALAGGRSASAGGSRGTKRLLVVFTPDGTIHDRWRPSGSQTDFTLGPILAPLAPFQDKMTILGGVDRRTNGAGDGHEQGMTQMLTGRGNLPGETRSTGPSIDELVNLEIGGGRPAMRLGVLTPGYVSNWTCMNFGESGSPLGLERDPYRARDDFFADFDPASVGEGPTDLQLRREAIREHALGFATGRLDDLVLKASAEDRVLLESHAEALRRLGQDPASGDPVAACSLDRLDAWRSGVDVGAHDSFPEVARMHADLIAAAFICDRARVGVLQFSHSNSELYHPWAGANAEHHGLSHYEFGYSDPFRTDALTGIYTWYAEQIAALVAQLDAAGTLDDTVVLWMSEMGSGHSHSNTDIPMVLIGTGGGHFAGGRYMDYRAQGGVSHCDVLTSVCNAMGIETDGFGEAATGPLVGVT